MGRLIYCMITSLDGYVADERGAFDWSVPDDEVHAFANELQRPIGTCLYGRRLYEVMVAWETMPTSGQPDAIAEFAGIWRAADKVVYSRSLAAAGSARTRIAREFDVTEVARLKGEAPSDLVVGGPTLAATALRAGLVDEVHQLLSPVVVGGGTPFLPEGVKLALDLLDHRRFGNGVVYLRYAVSGGATAL